MSSFLERYSAVSKELGLEYVRKGTPEYDQIMEVMNSRWPKKIQTPEQLRWTEACNALGYRFVKKGTPEYEAVKAYFKKMK
jgi:hypothetical protein